MTSTVYALSGYKSHHLWDENQHPAFLDCSEPQTEQKPAVEGKAFSDETWQGKWQPSNLREHSEVAWSTGERAGKDAHSLSAHREQDLKLHRW